MGGESDAAAKKSDANAPLKSLGKYQIERKLGQGGMGTVYLAMNTDLKKLVALKVLPRDKAQNPVLVRRFKAEAQAAGQLEHPNIVAVYDSGEADGYLYIAMEYVEGIDLFEQVKRRGVIPVKRSIEIIKQVAMALQNAFEHNIVHRDIKPSNLLLKQDGTVKVTDLGLARSIDDTLETNITRAGTTVGTVDYMSPEQARNSKSADVRSDIYSLGCTWYQMLTGQPPYSEGSVTNKLQAHAIKPLPDPRELNENIPEGLFAILQRMTAKKPADRYQTPAELLEDLANAKLTKAQFSNEIFSDLSDYDMDAAKNFDGPSDEDEEDSEPEPEEPRGRKHPAAEPDDNEPRMKSVRRKPRSRVEYEEEEPSDPEPRRKSSKTPDSRPVEETTPSKSRFKPIAKSRVEEEDDEEEPGERSRTRPKEIVEEEDEPSSSKTRRRSQPTSDEEDSSSKSRSKNEKSGTSQKEKRSTPHVPKPLPPKSLPSSGDIESQPKLNLDFLKFLGIAAGVLAVIGGLGWLIGNWGNQIEAPKPLPPQANSATEPVIVSRPSPKKTETTETEDNSLTLVEPTKPTPERTTTNEFDIVKQPLPAWVTASATEPADLPAFSVGPGILSTNHFANLDDALRAAGRAGGIVRLVGNGPFLLSRIDLGNAKKLIVTAATPQDQPLIIVAPASPDSGSGLSLTNGTLDLRGLHFVFDRPAQDIPTSSSVISVTDGQLFVRKCSFTATGDDASAVSALAFLSSQDSQNVPVVQPEALIDRVMIRGNGLTGLKIERTMAEVVIQDSLMVTGSAPCIEISGMLNASIADNAEARPRRLIRVLRSTLSGRKKVLELAAQNSSKPPSTSIYFQDSICSAEGAGSSSVLLSASRWPSISSATTGWLTHLQWTSQSSLYVGFERLIDLDKSSYKVTSVDDWQRVWGGKKFEKAQFQSLAWQESLFADLSAVVPHEFDNTRIPFRDVVTSKGNLPGCPTSQLVVPSFISQARLIAIGHRPKSPGIVPLPIDGPLVKKVNLLKEDLGVILNKNDWPNGTVFEATGAGLLTMVPARIVGKSVRIVFRQGDGAPLRIQPKVNDQKGKSDFPGLFSIEKGTLEIEAAVLESSQSAKPGTPPWVIFARNANLILRACQLNGPMVQDLTQHQGLIEWGTTVQSQPMPGVEPNFLSINDSILLSTGVGVRFQSVSGNLFLRNCIFGIRGVGVDLQPIRVGANLASAADIQHVSFATSKAAIRIEAASGSEAVGTPMRLFVDNCAILPPLEFKPDDAAQSTVVEFAGPVIEQKQIEWWGSSNGFAKELKSFLRQSGADPVTSASGWTGVWGESNEVRLLTGPKGVQLKTTLPGKWTGLKANSFMLDPTSAGATWAEGGNPVGADIRQLEDAMVARKVSGETRPGSTAKPATPLLKSALKNGSLRRGSWFKPYHGSAIGEVNS